MEQVQREKDQKPEDRWEIARMPSLNGVLEEDADCVDEEEVLVEDSGIRKNKMPRPYRKRRVYGKVNSSYFKPAGIPLSKLQEINLEMPEFEAIRLIDFKKIPQEEAAKQMNISQPTFSRILKSAREKIADAVINGKSIKIEK
jgi:uncharacterized protein